MRLGFDAHVLTGRPQGTKTLMLRLINEVARLHPQHEVYVYADALHPELRLSKNLHFKSTPPSGSFRRLLSTLPRAKRRDRLDTMIYNFISSPNMRGATTMIHDILAQTHSRYFNPRFVVRCYLLFGLSSLLARHLFTISDHSAREIQRIYPWTRKKRIHVLHIGPSFDEDVYFDTPAAPVGLPAQLGRYALCVGRIEPRKNIQMAIDAFLRTSHPDTRLVIVGAREGASLDGQRDSRVVELGGVSDEDLINLYRGASLFIYPSIAEGFGLPLLDALLFGVPVISSSLTSMAEVGGECVEFFDPNAPDATEWLSDRIERHFTGEPVRAATLEQRRERAARYSWPNAARQLVEGIELGLSSRS